MTESVGPEPLKLKPHHLERIQRFLKWESEKDKDWFKPLEEALKKDPDAKMVFISDYDIFCKDCIEGTEDKIPPCVKEFGSHDGVAEIDKVVAEEHGWEFDKPYKIADIIAELKKEAADRTFFHICKLQKDEFQTWLEDIRRSKGKSEN